MTTCAVEVAAEAEPPAPSPAPSLAVAANGAYAARLVRSAGGGCWYPERWTLDGPEPYVVPLPGHQPEEPDSGVLPLTDGRVLIRRRIGESCGFALLYPSGPGTGELPLGSLDCGDGPDTPILVPPAAAGTAVYVLTPGETSTVLWAIEGTGPGAVLRLPDGPPLGPRYVTRLPGRCESGVWLDRTGDLLAVDRELDGRTKTVVVDLRCGGRVSPLLEIAEDSNDRLLLADPDSGLLVVRSDAPGHERLGWGVLGSRSPIRFPGCLRLPDAVVTPFAVQPGQVLQPESCAVALRIDGEDGGSRVGVWRPAVRQLRQIPAPGGWLAGAGVWTREGELRLPYTTAQVSCGLARTTAPVVTATRGRRVVRRRAAIGGASAEGDASSAQPETALARLPVRTPVPLRLAPLVPPRNDELPAPTGSSDGEFTGSRSAYRPRLGGD